MLKRRGSSFMSIDTTSSAAPAGFLIRLAAKLCDLSISFALQVLVFYGIAVLDTYDVGSGGVLALATVTLSVLVPFAYFQRGSFGGRQTLGYRLAGIKVETMDGKPLSFWRGFVRTFLWLVAQSLSYLGVLNFLWILFNKEKRAGHDLATGTHVVKVNTPRPALLWGISLTWVILMGLWIRQLVPVVPFQAFYVPSGSMESTVRLNDRILTNTLAYRFRDPRNGDIAVFKAPEAALLNQNATDVDFIKRVVGTPGQTVEIKQGKLFVNRKAVAEPYALWNDDLVYDLKIVGDTVYSREKTGVSSVGPWCQNMIPVEDSDQKLLEKSKPGKVPAGQYLMLGDHRSNSNDSHTFGFVPHSAFQARAFFIFWPLNHWASLR
jgi:signal peptidase I